jgi:hypothetical protein
LNVEGLDPEAGDARLRLDRDQSVDEVVGGSPSCTCTSPSKKRDNRAKVARVAGKSIPKPSADHRFQIDSACPRWNNDTSMEPFWRLKMPAITVKNIPEDLYERLKRTAKANRRSINSEIILCLERQLRSRTRDPENALAGARRLRQKTADYIISDREFSDVKADGRP